ncbi:MAG TPA: glycosyltransferase [Acidimicrobiales bacterium]|nr:glycosyltransferase [Acidimicrobiales bacterium]
MSPRAPDAAAAVFVAGPAAWWAPTLTSLRRSHPDLPIVVGAPRPEEAASLAVLDVEIREAGSASQLVTEVWADHRCHLLAVTDRGVFPTAVLDPARRILDADMRVATVSFLSNAAAFLSFPHRNTAVSHQVESFDEESITRILRTTRPHQEPAPIPFAAGPATLLSSFALSAIGALSDVGDLRFAVALADFSLRGRRKGFLDVVDPSTFVARPYDLGALDDPWLDDDERRWLLGQHPYFASILDEQAGSDDSALATVHTASRAKVLGLRVLVDGSCLGPKEMGTQVQTTSLVGALTRRPDVERVCVSLATQIPPYAAGILSDPKVDARFVADGDVSDFGWVDVGHRPFQPVGTLHPSWFKVAARTAVTIQDLTSYHVGIYHASADDWMAHRDAMRQVTGEVDGVVVISHDVRQHLLLERLPIESERVAVVENGTDHLRGDESESVPRELLARGFLAGQFAVVLGTNYAHKNRDVAVEVVAELRRRGRALALVMAGAAVPYGSSRVQEAEQMAGEDEMFTLPDVTSEERNWLLHHAAVVLYPTSAEGFGLVPYEAARFGTPTVMVPFGPLGEVVGDLPVTAVDWSPESLADAAEEILSDPATARRQVAAALRSGADFTWDATAAKLVEVYRSLLAAPARGGFARP